MPKHNYQKDYKTWMGVKAGIHNENTIRSIKEGDVWWAAVGENVGTEFRRGI